MHNSAMRTPPTPTKVETIRLTIPVSAEVHSTFQRLAKAGNMPIGRAMGEWLGDTLDAATFMAQTMEKARAAPKLVAQELHAYALGLGDETKELMNHLREKGREAGTRTVSEARPAARSPAHTPPSNTGVTSNKNKPNRGQK